MVSKFQKFKLLNWCFKKIGHDKKSYRKKFTVPTKTYLTKVKIRRTENLT